MQFTSSEEIDAPIEAVFREVTDFAAFERSARRRGAEVRRTDMLAEPGVGMGWHARFTLRGQLREVDIVLVTHDAPNAITLDAGSQAVTGRMQVDLLALSPARTRLAVDLTVAPQGLAGRMMMQPVKLMRGNLDKRFRLRVAAFATDVEDRFKSRV